MGIAGLKVCNQTSDPHSVAIGYQSNGEWVSEGWWNIDPGACSEPISGDLKSRYYYLFATAKDRTFHGEGYSFCTQLSAFTIVGDKNCEGRGFDRSNFAQIDTGETSRNHVHNIVEATQKQDGGKTQQSLEQQHSVQPSAPRTASGLVRGQHGEPYTDRLMFQSCDVIDGLEACSFVGNGWRFYAFYDDPTPSAYLRQFENLPVNTPVQVTGDLTFYEGTTAELAITQIEPLWGQDAYANIRTVLQGDWVSADDGNETLYIFGSEMHSYYEGGYSDTYLLSVDAECDESAGAGPVLVQTSVTYNESFCYLIDNIEGGWLDLILMGHEAMISYRKVY
jgi:uncharacterized membrane protein